MWISNLPVMVFINLTNVYPGPCTCANSWEGWLLTYVFIVLRRRRFPRAAFLLSDGILIVAVFPHFLGGGEHKNRGNRIIVK